MKYLARKVILKGDDGKETVRHLQYIDFDTAGGFTLRDFDREREGYSYVDEIEIDPS